MSNVPTSEELEAELRAFTMRVYDPAYEGNPLAEMVAYIESAQIQLLERLMEQKHVYNAKSTDGVMNEPNTGVLAVPLSTIQGELDSLKGGK